MTALETPKVWLGNRGALVVTATHGLETFGVV